MKKKRNPQPNSRAFTRGRFIFRAKLSLTLSLILAFGQLYRLKLFLKPNTVIVGRLRHFLRRFVVQLIFLAQMFLGSIRKKLPDETFEILKFKMAAAAILDYLNL